MSYKEQILSKYTLLESQHADLMNEIEQLDEVQLEYKHREDQWSIIQVLNHLKDTETGTLRYIQKKLKYGGLRKVDWSAGVRVFLMKSVNNSSLKFKMPSVLAPPSAEGTLPSIQNEWAELRIEWKTFITEFPEEHLFKAVFKHPIFGRMSFIQAMDSMISHQNHHLKQIIRIKKHLGLNKNS